MASFHFASFFLNFFFCRLFCLASFRVALFKVYYFIILARLKTVLRPTGSLTRWLSSMRTVMNDCAGLWQISQRFSTNSSSFFAENDKQIIFLFLTCIVFKSQYILTGLVPLDVPSLHLLQSALFHCICYIRFSVNHLNNELDQKS